MQPGFPIKSWKNFLALSCNKTEVVKFLLSFWKRPECRVKLGQRALYVTQEEECWKLTSSSVEIVPELRCNHEEADTRIVLHAQHSQSPFIVHTDDTDVLVLLVSHSGTLNRIGYLKMGKGSKTRIIPLHLIRDKLSRDVQPGVTTENFLKSLIGLHAFTGIHIAFIFLKVDTVTLVVCESKNEVYTSDVTSKTHFITAYYLAYP